MPFPLLSPRSNRSEDRSTEQPFSSAPVSPTSINNPGPYLFDVRSSDTNSGKLNLFRRIFSSSDDRLSPRASDSDALAQRRSSLVPPNYTPMFKMPQIDIVHADPKKEWALHTISVADNGLRNQIRHMYNILKLVEDRPMDLTMDDVDLFYKWFDRFYTVMVETFALEESCLYAWIEQVDILSAEQRKWRPSPSPLSGPLSEPKRILNKGDILRLARDVIHYREKLGGAPVCQSLPELAYIIGVFATHLLAYLDIKKCHLPSVISEKMDIKDRRRFEKQYWNAARHSDIASYLVVALTYWMSKKEVRYWKSKCYLVSGKGQYGKWSNSFRKQYDDIIGEFSRRVIAAEGERHKQGLLNEMARARAVRPPRDDDQETVKADEAEGSKTFTSCGSAMASFSYSGSMQVTQTLK